MQPVVSSHGRRSGELGLRVPEIHPALRRKLRPVADHAGRDAADIGNFRAAQAERIAAAGLLLFESVGIGRARQKRKRERRGEYGAKLRMREPDDKHESPHPFKSSK